MKNKKIIKINGVSCFWTNWRPNYFPRDICKNKMLILKKSNRYLDCRFGSKKKVMDKWHYRIQVLVPVNENLFLSNKNKFN